MKYINTGHCGINGSSMKRLLECS